MPPRGDAFSLGRFPVTPRQTGSPQHFLIISPVTLTCILILSLAGRRGIGGGGGLDLLIQNEHWT